MTAAANVAGLALKPDRYVINHLSFLCFAIMIQGCYLLLFFYYCGYTSNCSSEANFIEEIVESISQKLNGNSLPAGSTRFTVVHKKDSSATTINVDASKHQATTKAKRTCCACSICVKLLCFLVFCVILTVLLAYFVSYFFGNRLSIFS